MTRGLCKTVIPDCPRNINSGYSAATNSTGARTYAQVVSLVAQQSQSLPTQQTLPQPVSATPVITSNIPRYSSVQLGNQHFTPASMENTTIHSGDDVQRPTNSVSNGTVTRDQPTYINLYDNRESVLVNFSLSNIQGLVTKYTNKLLSTELTQIFQNNDIILLTETWKGE